MKQRRKKLTFFGRSIPGFFANPLKIENSGETEKVKRIFKNLWRQGCETWL